MNFLLNSFPLLLTRSATPAELARLSEAELLARYPALAVGATLLFCLGVVADVYIVLHFLEARRAHTLQRVTAKPWSVRDVLAGALALVFTLVLGSLIVVQISQRLHLTVDAENSLLLGGELLMRFALLVALTRYLRRLSSNWSDAFGLRAGTRRGAITLGIITYLAILPPLGAFFAGYAKLCQLIGVKQTPQPIAELFIASQSYALVWLILLFAVIVAPLFEEVLFRGFAYPALKQRWGVAAATVITSVVFALIHFHVPSMGPLFALSVGIGLSYEMTGSLLTPITIHILFNATNTAMLLYVRSRV